MGLTPIRLLLFAMIVLALQYGWKHMPHPGAGGSPTAEALRSIASTVQPGEVTMYSTTECAYCAQARAWLTQYGFAFTECNMSLDRRCEREFLAYGATGTPYLVIRRGGRTYHMKDGFDSEEFLRVLKG
ncbi:MAG TPA: glutaredoxin family protein [Rhodocyclaceae bacterium]|uniref:glutaredoxin family protein n=1 Tax=Zoogloea sp. TaxID=49181 RepID=UPI002BB0F63E|nr:glutaredoxin family protein [Zoogloea sp.]HMV18001.1 glutaredoxin family protein [Rhodocyclaceae bacterium]HMV63660.1 glutaredoxin family protein [Rhodocyclaceae bacterium]HMW53059.1 glutaredoxin family protein [Rhodocyclaceae bacterium]HMZ77454.1 glutaredoxin family protein [Rhodocyclaceae bacterium]HNA69018.1 glutaredoxin family protein [Rhodocyclaceae bacterium]